MYGLSSLSIFTINTRTNMALDAGAIVGYVFTGIIVFIPAIIFGGGIILFVGFFVLYSLSTILKVTRIYDCVFHFTPQEFRYDNRYPSDYPRRPTSAFFCLWDPFVLLFQLKSLWRRKTKNLPSFCFGRRTRSSDLLPTYRKESSMSTSSIDVQGGHPVPSSSTKPTT
ncbi:hypothetical protein BJV82DRAFT_608415 [Fennellomyces sp. T-0311]|nr:hypothetical protein BJV82DRAFT_608415 [Fennellomyces sp. T-0311]